MEPETAAWRRTVDRAGRWHVRWAVATLFVLAVISACGDRSGDGVITPAPEPPDSEPSIVGVVTDVAPSEPITGDCRTPGPDVDPDEPVTSDDPPICTDPNSPILGTVLIEEDPGSESGDLKISFTVESGTAVLVERGGDYATGTFADLAAGTSVRARSDGTLMESYPMQTTAATIVIAAS